MAWVVTLDFQDGYGARDITAYVLKNTFRRSLVWANELSPASSQLTFSIHNNTTIANLFLSTATKDILVTVTKDGSGYFSGIVQNQFEVGLGTRLRPVSVKCVDRGELLRRKIKSTFAWADYEVCTPSATATSIVHALLTLAGFTSGEWNITEVINKTIDYFVIVETEGRTYWDVLEKLLFEFGYTFYFDATGDFRLGELYPATATSTQTFDETNIVGVLSLGKQARRFEGVEVEWCAHKTLTGALVFSDTTGGDETTKCYIPVAASDHHPDGVEDYDVYCEYAVEGYELIYVASAAIDWLGHSDLVLDTFTSYYRRALVDIRNSNGSSTRYITKLDITGTAVVRGDPRFTVCEFVAGTEKADKITAEWITTSADAKQLASGVMRHYRYGYITYRFASRTLVDPGAIVTVQDPILGMDNKVRIASRVDDERTGLVIYEAYGLEAYVAETDTTTGRVVAPKAAPPPVSPHAVTVAASGYQGVADWYCDGEDDDVQIQAANDYLAEAYGGGTIRLTEGSYNITVALSLSSGVQLIGRGVTSVLSKDGNDYVIEVIGTSGTHKENVAIRDLAITRESGDTTNNIMVVATYVDGLYMDGVTFIDSYYGAVKGNIVTRFTVQNCRFNGVAYRAIEVQNGDAFICGNEFFGTPTRSYYSFGIFAANGRVTIAENMFYDIEYSNSYTPIILNAADGSVVRNNRLDGLVLELASNGFGGYGLIDLEGGGSDCIVEQNVIRNCIFGQRQHPAIYITSDEANHKISGNSCVDVGNIIDRGYCEETTAPMMDGETTPVTSNATWARDSGQKHFGSYSYKFTKTNATGTYAYIAFTDSVGAGDLHGFVPGCTYLLKAWVYIPSGGIQASEVVFDFHDGSDDTVSPAATYDEWQEVTLEFTVSTTATLAYLYLYAAAEAAINEYFYVDDVTVQPLGKHNEHGQHFSSAGTLILEAGNSWQNPFAA